LRKLFQITLVVAVVVLAAMQFHRPDGPIRPVNPAATIDAQLHPSAQVSNLLHQSCYNCHSEQGEHPLYSNVWPVSALIQNDMREGRARLDFSEWDRLSPEMSRIRLLDSCSMMRESKMPLWYYRPLHPTTATPKPQDIEAFCAWAQTVQSDRSVASLK
jgi:hypothetical protein